MAYYLPEVEFVKDEFFEDDFDRQYITVVPEGFHRGGNSDRSMSKDHLVRLCAAAGAFVDGCAESDLDLIYDLLDHNDFTADELARSLNRVGHIDSVGSDMANWDQVNDIEPSASMSGFILSSKKGTKSKTIAYLNATRIVALLPKLDKEVRKKSVDIIKTYGWLGDDLASFRMYRSKHKTSNYVTKFTQFGHAELHAYWAWLDSGGWSEWNGFFLKEALVAVTLKRFRFDGNRRILSVYDPGGQAQVSSDYDFTDGLFTSQRRIFMQHRPHNYRCLVSNDPDRNVLYATTFTANSKRCDKIAVGMLTPVKYVFKPKHFRFNWDYYYSFVGKIKCRPNTKRPLPTFTPRLLNKNIRFVDFRPDMFYVDLANMMGKRSMDALKTTPDLYRLRYPVMDTEITENSHAKFRDDLRLGIFNH
jgi:hypothetical protein